MNKFYILVSAALLLFFSNALIAAEQQEETTMNIEAIVTQCEEQFTTEAYPDDSERYKLVDKCVDEKSGADQKSTD